MSMTRPVYTTDWQLSGSSDPRALAIVDGTGEWAGNGPHYSRRTPGSKTFTGVGQEIVLVRPGAVWAVVRSRVPHPVGSGASRGRGGASAHGRWVWRNMMFRNLSDEPASVLIRSAVEMTAREWVRRYGELPEETLQTEVRADAVRSEIPGYCYRRAGRVKYRETRGLVYFRCPRTQIERALNMPTGPHNLDEREALPNRRDPRDRPLDTGIADQGSGGAA